MGTEFFWFYDVILIGIILFNIFIGLKRGFVRMLLSMFSTVIAFMLAFVLSGVTAEWAYDTFINDALQTSIAEKVNETLSGTVVSELASLDFDNVTVAGEPLSSISVEPDNAGKITVKLDDIDLSKTGIDKVDLSSFGVDKNTDFSKVDLGTVQFYESELENNSLDELILAHFVADNIEKTEAMEEITDAVNEIAEKLPVLSGSKDSGDGYILRNVVTTVVNAGGEPGDAIVNNMIKPVICSLIRTLIFIVLFVIIKLLLSIIIRATSIVNKIPLINKFNEFLGGIMGLVHGVVVIFIVVIIVHLVVIITDNTLIFLNEMTIDKSFAFNWIYNFKFLDFISKFN